MPADGFLRQRTGQAHPCCIGRAPPDSTSASNGRIPPAPRRSVSTRARVRQSATCHRRETAPVLRTRCLKSALESGCCSGRTRRTRPPRAGTAARAPVTQPVMIRRMFSAMLLVQPPALGGFDAQRIECMVCRHQRPLRHAAGSDITGIPAGVHHAKVGALQCDRQRRKERPDLLRLSQCRVARRTKGGGLVGVRCRRSSDCHAWTRRAAR